MGAGSTDHDMRAEIICVGSELLLGDIADRNTQYLARRLSRLGIDLHYSTSVGDNLGRLLECLRRAFDRSDIILTTGGLGPTEDDLTREAIAMLLGETLFIDEGLATQLRVFFELRGMEMTPNNLKQASRIPSARVIPNTHGTAPGWWVIRQAQSIIAMPGPPGELHHMWETEIEPELTDGDSVIRSRTLKLFNTSESRVDQILRPLTAGQNPTVAVYAKQDGIYVRITAKASDDDAARQAIQPIELEARRRLGEFIWGTDDDTQASVTADLLLTLGRTIAVGETATAGTLATMLTSVPKSEQWFRGGLVLPASELCPRDARALAHQVAEHFRPDVAIAVCANMVEDSSPAMDEIIITIIESFGDLDVTAVHRARRHRVRLMGSYYAMHELRRALAQREG